MASDEPARKKRGADNQLTQDNWQAEDGDDDAEQSGPFKEAAEDELKKRRIVKARRSGSGAAGPVVAPEKPAAAANTSSAGGFSWTKPVAAEEGAKEETSDKNGDEAKKPAESPAKEDTAKNGTAGAESKDGEKKEESPAKKPALPAFSGFGSSGGFGSGAAPAFTFSSVAAGSTTSTFGTGAGFGFGSGGTAGSLGSSKFTFGTAGKAVGFGDVSSGGWAKKDDEEGGEGDAGGEDEDPEKELQAKKFDPVVQLEEVETATGEEDETTAFQVRAKLFMLDTSGDGDKGSEEEKGSSQKTDSTDADKKDEKKDEKKDAEKKLDWVVIGIGNLKVNVPKPGCDDKSRRPRVIMRRQKTFQLCLNSYLFANMICDRAGPKDVRFTGMKSSEDDKDKDTKDGVLATFLVRVKEEESAKELIAAINKHKNTPPADTAAT